MKVLVLGAGVIGTTTAYFLAKEGHEVTVVDRATDVAQGTSFANGGIIHISLVDPWNAPGTAFKFWKWIGREDSPALLRPGAIPGMLGWGLAFLRNSSRSRHAHHTLINLRLALYSARVLKTVRAEAGLDYDHGERGLMKVFRDRESLDHATALARFLEPHGVRHRALSVGEVVALEPALGSVAGELAGGVHFPDDESGDARRFTRAIADRAEAMGVDFRFGARIERLDVKNGAIAGVATPDGRIEADAYVLALGTDSPRFGRELGIRLPIYPVKGYSLTAPLDGWNDAPATPVVDETLKVAAVPLGDRLRLAGNAEFAGHDLALDERRAGNIWNGAVRMYPALARHVERAKAEPWTGLRPMTPDGPPILGATKYPNLFLNTGHGHLGWTMAAGSARVVADIVSGREPEIDLDGLLAARFQ